MRRIDTNWLGVADGFVTLFDHWQEPSEMWEGVGERQVRAVVTFERPFTAPPSVTLSTNLIDAHSGPYLRLNLRAEDVAESGFTLIADTWDDTRIARLGVRWQALGPLTDPDEVWDV
ncbi:H-type lectin domain-containing protein [Roseobacter sp. HKCCA0434]|uniref:H-type lectin domain-containing protein n=1 Tax=Roseobacter sp. HKCCA0434 TaxID=3079297 RepID=UPI00290580C9|nr:H-type lectin domain-containing protein [Roseobacter sp. HKCCA0434]